MASLPACPDMIECGICMMSYNFGARSHERLRCTCGQSICHGCRMSLPDPHHCPHCREPFRVEFEPFTHQNADLIATVNQLIECLSAVRHRTLLQGRQLEDQRADIACATTRTDHLLDLGMTHNNLLRRMQDRIAYLEEQVFLMARGRPVQV